MLIFFRYEGALDPWLLNLWKALKQTKPTMFPYRLERLNTKSLDRPKVQITFNDANEVQSQNLSSSGSDLSLPLDDNKF